LNNTPLKINERKKNNLASINLIKKEKNKLIEKIKKKSAAAARLRINQSSEDIIYVIRGILKEYKKHKIPPRQVNDVINLYELVKNDAKKNFYNPMYNSYESMEKIKTEIEKLIDEIQKFENKYFLASIKGEENNLFSSPEMLQNRYEREANNNNRTLKEILNYAHEKKYNRELTRELLKNNNNNQPINNSWYERKKNNNNSFKEVNWGLTNNERKQILKRNNNNGRKNNLNNSSIHFFKPKTGGKKKTLTKWQKFLKKHKGKGKSMDQLSRMYKKENSKKKKTKTKTKTKKKTKKKTVKRKK